MSSTRLIHTIGAALLVSIGAQTALAQAALTQADASASPASTAAPTPWSAHPAGKYRLELTVPERFMQVDLTISDSAGKSVALFWPVGDHDGHTMSVTVKDTELFLDAVTPRGPVQIVLLHQGDNITGRWTMGADKGLVQGHVEH